MEIAILLQTLAYVPTLASHPFLVAFVIALLPQLLLQFPDLYDKFSGSVLAPLWFSQPLVLIILGILTLLEISPVKRLNLRTWLNEYDPPLKAGIALLISFALIDSVSTGSLRGLIVHKDLAGFSENSGYSSAIGFVWSLTICTLTWIIAVIQPGILPSASLLLPHRLTRPLSDMLDGMEAVSIISLVILATISPSVALGLFAVIGLGQAALRQYRKSQQFTPVLHDLK